MAVFEYKNGVSFAKTTAVEHGGFSRRQLVVNGTKKTVELNPLEAYAPNSYTRLTTKRVERDSMDWRAEYTAEESEVFDRYTDMLTSFAQMVRGEKKNPYTLEYELELYKTVLKACGEKI